MNTRLRHAREQRGLTLRDVSRETGIPTDILAALEEEVPDHLDPRGLASRSLAAYERFLGVAPALGGAGDEDYTEDYTASEVSGTGVGRRRVPLPRLLAAGLVLVAIVVLGLRVFALLVDEPVALEPVEEPLDQEITLRAVEPTRIEVEVDGTTEFAGILAPHTATRFAGHDRVSVYIPDLTRVRVVHNGRTVVPLGNQSAGRRLVFIDDSAP